MSNRRIWIVMVLCLAVVAIPARAVAQSDTQPSGTTRPAVITLSAGSAELRGSGDQRRLTLNAVAPTIAMFDVDDQEALPVTTWSAVDFLRTRPSVVAVVQSVDTDSDGETERLQLSKLDYDSATGDLTAVARPVGAAKVPGLLQEAAHEADGDGKLPDGPVKLLVFDDDTKVTANGEPLPTAAMMAPSDYAIDVNLIRDNIPANWTVTGTANPYCINTADFSVPVLSERTKLTTFTVDQSLRCIVRAARVEYEISVNGQKATDLVVQQVGPRSFVTTCSDVNPYTAECGNDWWQVQLHIID